MSADSDRDPPSDALVPIGPGTIVGDKYLLGKAIGAGGMGQVFHAEHLLLHVPVAVKVLHSFVAADPRHERRFQHEARAAAVLNHPNVVRVLDFGHHRDTSFIVMEFIQGVSLDHWLFEQPVLPPIHQVADIMLQLLSALESAHALNIVHRDLKPENVLLTHAADGRLIAKIVDFGLAHVEDPQDQGPTLTQRDAIAGTPAYMSPEQCRSLIVGPSTDLYAIGCLLTTMLQGTPPFDGAAAMDVIAKQMFLPPSPLDRPMGLEPVPPLLERLRLDLLAKQPHARPKDAATTAERLREAVSAEGQARRLPSRKGDIPLGRREQHALRPSIETLPEIGKSSLDLTIDVITLGSHPDGWSESTLAGLAAQGIAVASVGSDTGARHEGVTVIDAGDDIDAAIAAVRAGGGAMVVCVQRLSSESMNRLIEAGASEVLRYPIAPDNLAKRIRRAAKRRSS